MTDDVRARNEEKWKEATNRVIAAQQVSNIEKLLGGKARHYVCSDKFTTHEKIVIEYNHETK
jgi:hypothetical protein